MPRSLTAEQIQKHNLTAVKAACDAEFAWVEPEIAAAEGESKLKKFSITAYTGTAMRLGFGYPMVVDLAGMSIAGESLPILKDHDPTKIVGHTDASDKSLKRLKLTGIVSGVGEAAQEVLALGANGFPWQASIGAAIEQVEFVEKGETVTVNGRSIAGPVYVARKSTLRETSFVAIGADAGTSGRIAANNQQERTRVMDQELKAYIEGMGFDPAALSETQVAGLKASFDASKKKPVVEKTRTIDEILAANAAESERISAFNEIMATATLGRPRHEIDELKKTYDTAVEAHWDVDKFRLAMHQNGRFNVAIHASGGDKLPTEEVLEAAICSVGRLSSIEKRFSPQVLEAAHKRFKTEGIGLKQLFLICAESQGYRGNYSSNLNIDVQRAAFGMDGQRSIRASGFSTVSIANVISNVANKFLMDGWNAVDMTPMRLAVITPVRDFKEITTVSLTGDLQFEKVGAAGEIKHGTIGDKAYGNKADTFAKMLAITRQDMINDDLGALTAVPRRMGRGGALKLNDIFWTEFLNPSVASFFSSGNANVSTDTGALGLTGLDQAYTKFMLQTDPDGKPLGLEPKILLVPTALKTTAITLMTSEKIKGDANEADGNVWRDRFRVESSPYMSNAAYSGYSAVKWYLLADPNELPLIEIVALNGRVEPVVETADADFNVLGVQMRGYSDVGVRVQEFRAGVQADGSTAG